MNKAEYTQKHMAKGIKVRAYNFAEYYMNLRAAIQYCSYDFRVEVYSGLHNYSAYVESDLFYGVDGYMHSTRLHKQ